MDFNRCSGYDIPFFRFINSEQAVQYRKSGHDRPHWCISPFPFTWSAMNGQQSKASVLEFRAALADKHMQMVTSAEKDFYHA